VRRFLIDVISYFLTVHTCICRVSILEIDDNALHFIKQYHVVFTLFSIYGIIYIYIMTLVGIFQGGHTHKLLAL
jgi:hypothetical protein